MNKVKRKRKIMWGFIYVTTFIVAFVASVIFKMTYDPSRGAYSVDWNESIGTVYTDLSYGESEANKFDLYLPADSNKDDYGLVVYLHAGGFTAGDKSNDADMLKWLCSKGYVAVGINYTLRTDENDSSVYSQSVEIRESIPYVVAEAEKRGYHLDSMAISGGSAGGCLALIYAYRDAETSPIPVKLVFEAVGPASFYVEDWGVFGLDQNAELAAAMFGVMSGVELNPEMIASGEYLEAVKPISADMWVSENAVPSVLCYGAHDRMQPFAATTPLVSALEKYGVDYQYLVAEHSGHGLQNDNKVYMKYMETVEKYLDRYMPVTE